MDWLRRNWPDLLIGIALVAVIAGIIATLITGGSFFTIGEPTNATTTPNSAPAPTVEAPGGAVPLVPNSTDTGGQSEVGTPSVVAPDVTPEVAGPTVAVLPPSDNSAPATPVVEAPAPIVTAPAVEATPAAAVPTPVAADPPSAASEEDAPFRVSVGAFSTLENAERQAQIFRDAGYPVLIGSQDALALVLVGPFALRSEAEQVVAQIEVSGLFDAPLIYTFEPDEDAEAATPAPPAPAPAAAPVVATVSEEGRLIQVGAYGSDDSAAPQRIRVTDLGFVVSSRVENGLVKLLVGPFSGEQLSAAQATLEAAGVANFVR